MIFERRDGNKQLFESYLNFIGEKKITAAITIIATITIGIK
jgi:hypothetical protein